MIGGNVLWRIDGKEKSTVNLKRIEGLILG